MEGRPGPVISAVTDVITLGLVVSDEDAAKLRSTTSGKFVAPTDSLSAGVTMLTTGADGGVTNCETLALISDPLFRNPTVFSPGHPVAKILYA